MKDFRQVLYTKSKTQEDFDRNFLQYMSDQPCGRCNKKSKLEFAPTPEDALQYGLVCDKCKKKLELIDKLKKL